MKIILISVGVFQKYILDNIQNLLFFNNTDIDIICDRNFFEYFKEYSNINLIPLDTIDYSFFEKNSKLDKNFRNGFWHYCFMRLFLLYEYIKNNNIINCIHLEMM